MSAEAESTNPTPAAPRKSRAVLIGAIIAGAIGGSAVGVLAITPAMTKSTVAAATDSTEGRAIPVDAGAPPVVLSNIVLNPADSRGTRFLLVSVGLRLRTAMAPGEFEKRETEVRDRVLQVLSTKSVDDLVDVSRRAGFRREIAASLDSLLGTGEVRDVYFPQFVIQ
ncbi:MAG: flagellar basal body-associated FliL family protein [Gemmatimonadaceae bacterium]